MGLPSELNFSRRRRLPVIQSAETAECGLACLAMIANYHGHDVDLNGLRQRFSISMAGASLRTLINISNSLGFTTRPLRAELDQLSKVATPAIIHWNFNHFVVLKSVRGDKVVIHDPSKGVRTFSLGEASNHFTGVVLELSPADTFEKVVERTPIRLTSLWSRQEGFWSAFAQILGLSLALQVVAFAGPFQMQLVVDEGIFRSDRDLLTVLAIAFGALIVLQATIEALRAWALQVFGQLLSFQMIGNIVHHLMRLPSNFFEKRHVGDILSRVSSATVIQSILTHGVISTLIDGVMSLIAVVILFLYSPSLACIVLGSVVLNGAVATGVYPALRHRMEEQLVLQAREQSHMMETVRAATMLRIMGRESEREGSWRNIYANVINASVSVGKYNISLALAQTIITGIQSVLVIYLGARAVIGGDGFSVGMLLAFLSFRQTFTDRTNALVVQLIAFRSMGLHLDRLSDIVLAEPEAVGPEPANFEVHGNIALQGLSFRYGVGDPLVLSDLNLEIRPGEFLAITGASGGGKTTLMRLLLGLNVPTEGRILLEGQPATPELWRVWRESVGVVSQDDRLLSGSIAENIAFFDPDMEMPRVQAAAVSARIHDDISKMPMGYQSLVGDMGSTLSGGQKQRVLLARALYRQPSILFLDEGTANLDEATEEQVSDFVESLSITRVVIAHRPSLLRRAHRVLTLQDNQLSRVTA